MKRILIKGAGGVAGIGMTRCLQKDYDVFGEDDSKWSQKLMTTLLDDGKGHDLIIPVADSMIPDYVHKSRTLLPTRQTVACCQNKDVCAEVLGELSPKTYWVRSTRGAGGKGAQMCSDYLPGDNISCELAYFEGVLLGSFIKKRLSYSVVGEDEPLDKRGSSMVSVCIESEDILDRAIEAVYRVSQGRLMHGAYGIDFKGTREGVPLITEINAGRFLTASYVYFYKTDYNLPLAMVKAYFGESYTLGEYPVGQGIIRAVDSEPWIGIL